MADKIITLELLEEFKKKCDTAYSGGSGGSATLMYETTYDELVAKISAGTLVKGALYRITDYQCGILTEYSELLTTLGLVSTSTPLMQAATNQFDIVVYANSASSIGEDARAMAHDGDTYFASCDLSKWELKYQTSTSVNVSLVGILSMYGIESLTSTGKGWISYMKDEFGNECNYDFKNIQFARFKITATTNPNKQFMIYDSSTNPVYWGNGFEGLGFYMPTTDVTFDLTSSKFYFTFDYNGSELSLQNYVLGAEIGYICYDNKLIGSGNFGNVFILDESSGYYVAKNNVAGVGYSTFTSNCMNNTIPKMFGAGNAFKGMSNNEFSVGTYFLNETYENYNNNVNHGLNVIGDLEVNGEVLETKCYKVDSLLDTITSALTTSDIGKLGSELGMPTFSIDGTSYDIRLIDIDHDDLADGTGKAHTTWELTSIVRNQYWNQALTTKGGWAKSDLRNFVKSFYSQLPLIYQLSIKNVSKSYYENYNDSTAKNCEDKLFCLSGVEIGGKISGSPSVARDDGTVYTYYNVSSESSLQTLRIKQYVGSNWYYWLRTTDSDDPFGAGGVIGGGDIGGYYVDDSLDGVSFAFSI